MLDGFWNTLVMVGVILITLVLTAAVLTWVERRLLGIWQDRYGPNRVGPFGSLQIVADIIKLLIKEDWVPPFADRPVFVLAPVIAMFVVLSAFAIVPMAPGVGVVDMNIGLLYFLAITSLGVYSVMLGAYASNSKYALIGGLRAAAQMLSYEVFMGLSLMGVVMLAGTFDLRGIVNAQADGWYFIPQFIGLVVFMIAGVAETHRTPFDLPEAEHELTAGFSYGILRHEIWHVFHWRISVGHLNFHDDRGNVFRWLAWALVTAFGLVLAQDGCFYHVLYLDSWRLTATTL